MGNHANGVNPQRDGDPQRPAGETTPLDRALDELRRDHPHVFAPAPGRRRAPRPRHHCHPIRPRWRLYLAAHRSDWASLPSEVKRPIRRLWGDLRRRHARYHVARFERFIGRLEIRFVD